SGLRSQSWTAPKQVPSFCTRLGRDSRERAPPFGGVRACWPRPLHHGRFTYSSCRPAPTSSADSSPAPAPDSTASGSRARTVGCSRPLVAAGGRPAAGHTPAADRGNDARTSCGSRPTPASRPAPHPPRNAFLPCLGLLVSPTAV